MFVKPIYVGSNPVPTGITVLIYGDRQAPIEVSIKHRKK
jgi:hypothetical protein